MNNVLDSVNQLLSNTITLDTDIERMANNNSMSMHEEYLITKRMKRNLESWGNQQTFKVNYMIFIPGKDITIHSCSDEKDYLAWYDNGEALQQYLLDKTQGQIYVSSSYWELADIAGKFYMTRFYKMDTYYMMSWIDIEDFIQYSVFEGFGDQSYLVFMDSKGSSR